MPQVRLQILNDREDRGTRPHGRKEKRVEGDVQRIQDPSKPCSCLFEETCIIGADEQHRHRDNGHGEQQLQARDKQYCYRRAYNGAAQEAR